MTARDDIHDRIHGPGYCDPPCGLCQEVGDLLDADRDEVLREAMAVMLDPENWKKFGFTKDSMKVYMAAIRRGVTLIDPDRPR